MEPAGGSDAEYLRLILDALEVCSAYRPKFGKRIAAGFTLEGFRALYRDDPFYTWFGLDSPLLYAAHRAAGGITSVYRQIGTGCERLFRQLLQDTLELEPSEVTWAYEVPGVRGRARTLSLDARISVDAIRDAGRRAAIEDWLARASRTLQVAAAAASALRGIVFEVRQGYKSKDAKRQDADIGNAAHAYANAYLPVVALFSTQIDADIEERYARAQWLILKGSLGGTSLDSTYVFCREVLGYDLAGFFERNSHSIKSQVEAVMEALLA